MEGLRSMIADRVVSRLQDEKENLTKEFSAPDKINSFILDDVLDTELAIRIHKAFPDKSQMKQKKSLREYKNIAAQMNNYDPILEEAVFAFQDNRIVKLIEEISGLKELLPDEMLYAGGISLMSKDNFLNPHLDNSHNNDRSLYRVLNLLYYITPNWKEEYGGNLELWDKGPREKQRTIFSKFNRLVVMITNKSSVHSVSRVTVDKSRCCVSNYYFSAMPAEKENYFHVTSFYGRPEEKVKSIILQSDTAVRNLIRKVFKKGVVQTKHIYKK